MLNNLTAHWYADDLQFRAMGPLTWHKLLLIWNPYTINWYYRPITKTLMLLWNLSGTHCGIEASEVLSHVFSLVILGLSCVTLAKLITRLITGPRGLVIGLCVSAYLLVVMSSNEAVTWACSAGSVLAVMFSLLALLNLLDDRPVWRVWLFAFLAMISKEDSALLPIALVILASKRKWVHGLYGIFCSAVWLI